MGQLLPNGKMMSLGYVKNMTDALRAEISKNQAMFKGTVLEISAQERLKSGKFRNPSIVMPRYDKDSSLCRYNPSVEA
jgi:ATP-dependent DNA ligase